MANALYKKFKERQLLGTAPVQWVADTIKMVLVDGASYTPDMTNHEFLSDIPIGMRIATSAALSGKTGTSGIAVAADSLFTAATGATSEYVVCFKDTGSAATSPLIALWDAGGLPITPNGLDITIDFGASLFEI